MKAHESGMQDESCWVTFFNVEKAAATLLGETGVCWIAEPLVSKVTSIR
jgi:hypothetical protein